MALNVQNAYPQITTYLFYMRWITFVFYMKYRSHFLYSGFLLIRRYKYSILQELFYDNSQMSKFFVSVFYIPYM